MAIIGMQRLSLFALAEDRDKLLKDLIRLGCLELVEPEKEEYDAWKTAVCKDAGESREISDSLASLSAALKALDKYAHEKTGFFKNRQAVRDGEFNTRERIDQALAKAEEINGSAKRIGELWNEENKLTALEQALAPWESCTVPLEFGGTRETDFLLGTLPAETDFEELEQSLQAQVPESIFEQIEADKELYYVAFTVHKAFFEQAFGILKGAGFVRSQFGEQQGTPADNITRVQEQMIAVAQERDALCDGFAAYKADKPLLEQSYDALQILLGQQKMRDHLLKTEKTVYINGWVAVDQAEELQTLLDKYTCAYELREPLEEEQPPVKIKNSKLIEPFGMVTEMYSLPDPRGMDPNPFMAPFFFLFFGMMVSDAGYGLVMALVSTLVLRKLKTRGMFRQLLGLMLWGGISTFLWGAVFGGWFGDLPQLLGTTITGKPWVIKPLLFNPLEEPMTMLFMSFAFGLVHIFTGLGLKAWMLIKRGKWLDAVYDVVLWWMLIIGALLMLVNPGVAKILLVVSVVALILTQSRTSKNIFGRIGGGLWALYGGLTGYFSDILSYSRLLALGLATGVIATVINTMTSLLPDKIMIVKIILMVVILIGGHLFNMAINLLGAYVHTSRLQYIEFFGKFYESGGEAFKPAKMETKYVDILKEDI